MINDNQEVRNLYQYISNSDIDKEDESGLNLVAKEEMHLVNNALLRKVILETHERQVKYMRNFTIVTCILVVLEIVFLIVYTNISKSFDYNFSVIVVALFAQTFGIVNTMVKYVFSSQTDKLFETLTIEK